MQAKRIPKHDKYWIHPDGYVFKIENQKEYILPINTSKYAPRVKIDSSYHNLVFLLINAFGDIKYSYKERSSLRYKYKVIDGKIPMNSIVIIEYGENPTFLNEKSFLYKCRDKANSANSRVMNMEQITESDVFNALLRTDFKCFYCSKYLNKDTWELDHVEPLSKSGLNVPTNITPSCKKCNRMKGAIPYIDFLVRCKLIADNFENLIHHSSVEYFKNEAKL